MFKPDEIIFAPTSRCQLVCAHCRVRRGPEILSSLDAIRFMESCRPHGIDRMGFSGGEPFLEPDFLCDVSRAAVELDFVFDRLMTNACWFTDGNELREILERLFDAGFDGTFGVSADAWHGQDPATLWLFIRTVFETWGRKDRVEIVSVQAADGSPATGLYEALAPRLGGSVTMEDDGQPAIVNERFLDKPDTGEDEPDALRIGIVSVPYSASADEEAWGNGPWFEDDRCAGPGNVFYVHPDGSVAACCGFANENEALIIGNIATDGYDGLMRRAGDNGFVRSCYGTGLGAARAELEKGGIIFPGTTADRCFFCDWLCREGLAGSRKPEARGRM
ncbi:MAG: hypothetical protein NT080_06550 [Spirochaetes bacterium]|nr:hypothetical protein [Spirochaetota bacterium]